MTKENIALKSVIYIMRNIVCVFQLPQNLSHHIAQPQDYTKFLCYEK